MFDIFLENLCTEISKLPFDWLVWGTVGSFAALWLVSFALTLCFARFKAASKRPFLGLLNAYTAVTFAMFILRLPVAQSLFSAALFWVAGFLLYGLLCACSAPRVIREERIIPAAAELQPATVKPARPVRADIPAARNNIRLEHAVSVTDKLLEKNLGKSDRQELEKLKNTLAVLQIKGTLSTAESEILNDNFNTLLKLMAKYNV